MNLPKKIHFTCPDKDNINNPIWVECLDEYYKIYKDYEIILYDDNDIYDVIEKHFPQFLNQVKQITIGAIISDLFRYLILYLEGGIYSDLDCLPLKHINSLLDENYIYYHGDKDRDNNFYLYNRNQKINNNRWDFHHNLCDNSKFIDESGGIKIMKCLGHKIDIKNTSTILSYELHKDWNREDKLRSNRLAYKGVGIAQWFIMTEPKQDVFLKMFMYCMDNVEKLTKLKQTEEQKDTYHYDVISTSGPLAFTKMVIDNISDNIKILPSDFFCNGSWGEVPLTENSFVTHKFTSSWVDTSWI